MGGIERVVLNLGRLLQRNGHNVKIVSIFQSEAKPFYDFEGLKVLNLSSPNIKYRNTFKGKILTLIKLYSFYKNESNLVSSEFYITTFPIISIMSVIISPSNRGRIIACEHSSYFAHGKLIRLIRAIAYRFVYKIVVLTKTDQKLFKSVGLNTKVIPNPLTSVQTMNRSERLVLNEDYEGVTCLSMGRLHADKGFDRLIELASFFRLDKVRFIIIGSGPEEKFLNNLIDKKNLQDKVFIRPSVKDISAVFNIADIFLMTSYTEAFPMVILESFQAGIPVISYDCPVGPREIIKNNINGFLVEDGNVIEYEYQLRKCLNKPEVLTRLAEGIAESLEEFSDSRIYNLWRQILISESLDKR